VKGKLALCRAGSLGLITNNEKQEVTYADGDKAMAYVGIHLTDKIAPIGSPWSSRAPIIVGEVTETQARLIDTWDAHDAICFYHRMTDDEFHQARPHSYPPATKTSYDIGPLHPGEIGMLASTLAFQISEDCDRGYAPAMPGFETTPKELLEKIYKVWGQRILACAGGSHKVYQLRQEITNELKEFFSYTGKYSGMLNRKPILEAELEKIFDKHA
jgi:hypothetical protein